jgi:chemotaxis protein methyltransferase CheR
VDPHRARSRGGLADAASLTSLGVFDAILCRNVFIYFSDETVRRVASHLLHALQPGGRVIVGVSESLLRFGTSFECEERGGAFLYRRAER